MSEESHGILITGSAGLLGREFCRQLGHRAFGLRHDQLDIACRSSVERALAHFSRQGIRIVINCAAYTAVDLAESEPEVCDRVNCEGVAILAAACEANGLSLVQISSDAVFGLSRDNQLPWREDDDICPLSVYGLSKRRGELAARRCQRHYIVRTCGLFGGTDGRSFVDRVLKSARLGASMSIVDDQICSPSYAKDVVKATLFLIGTGSFGTYHIANTGQTSWFHFAREALEEAQLELLLMPVASEHFGAAAPRPSFSALDTSRYHALGGPQMRRRQDALREYVNMLMTRGSSRSQLDT
jgi:dTDP-4-dehydrorhamnose reductase